MAREMSVLKSTNDNMPPRSPTHASSVAIYDESPLLVEERLKTRLAEIEIMLNYTAQHGNRLIDHKTNLQDKIKDLARNARNEARVSGDMKQKLIQMERDYNDLSKDAVKLPIRQPAQGKENTHFSDLQPSQRSLSPTKQLGKSAMIKDLTNISDFAQLSTPKDRENKDLEFAADLGQNLLVEVRRLHGLLAEKEETYREAIRSKGQLETEIQALETRAIKAENSEENYKEENWNLELQSQELRNKFDEVESNCQKLTVDNGRLNREIFEIKEVVEGYKTREATFQNQLTAEKTKYEQELQNAKKSNQGLARDRASLQDKFEDLQIQFANQSRKVTPIGGYLSSREQEHDSDIGTPDRPTTPNYSPPMSPVKATPARHAPLETETVKASLHHAHKMIAGLKSTLQKERGDKNELRRLLNDAREELELARKPSNRDAAGKRKLAAKKSRKSIHSDLLGDKRRPGSEIVADSPSEDEPSWLDRNSDYESSFRKVEAIKTDTENDTDDFLSAAEVMSPNILSPRMSSPNKFSGTFPRQPYESGSEDTETEHLDEDDSKQSLRSSKSRKLPRHRPRSLYEVGRTPKALFSELEGEDFNEDDSGNYRNQRTISEELGMAFDGESSIEEDTSIREPDQQHILESTKPATAILNSVVLHPESSAPISQNIINVVKVDASTETDIMEEDLEELYSNGILKKPVAVVKKVQDQQTVTDPISESAKDLLSRGIIISNIKDAVDQTEASTMTNIISESSVELTRFGVIANQFKDRVETLDKEVNTEILSENAKTLKAANVIGNTLKDVVSLQDNSTMTEPSQESAAALFEAGVIARELKELKATQTASTMTEKIAESAAALFGAGVIDKELKEVVLLRDSENNTDPIKESASILLKNGIIESNIKDVSQTSDVQTMTDVMTETAIKLVGNGVLGAHIKDIPKAKDQIIMTEQLTQSLEELREAHVLPEIFVDLVETRDIEIQTNKPITVDLEIQTEEIINNIPENQEVSEAIEKSSEGTPDEKLLSTSSDNQITEAEHSSRQQVSKELIDIHPVAGLEKTQINTSQNVILSHSIADLTPRGGKRMSVIEDSSPTPKRKDSNFSFDPFLATPTQYKDAFSKVKIFKESGVQTIIKSDDMAILLSPLANGPIINSIPVPSRSNSDYNQQLKAQMYKSAPQLRKNNDGLMRPPPMPISRSRASSITKGSIKPSVSFDDRPAPSISHKSSMSSFRSDLDARLNIENVENIAAQEVKQTADAETINCITQVMIGEYVWKYTRGRRGLTDKRHKRFFWINPYSKLLHWSDKDPALNPNNTKSKSIVIKDIMTVVDDNPYPPGLHQRSIVISTNNRPPVRFTLSTRTRYEIWLKALGFLLHRDLEPASSMRSVTRADVRGRSPSLSSRKSLRSAVPSDAPTNRNRSQSSLRITSNTNAADAPPMPTPLSQRLGSFFRPSSPFNTIATQRPHDFSQVADDPQNLDADEAEDSYYNHHHHHHHHGDSGLENVRACCDGRHDVSRLSRRGTRLSVV